jgi:hypothetical protein
MHATFSRDTGLLDDFLCEFRTDPVNIRQRNNNALCSRDVDASDTCHAYSPCVPVAIRQEGFSLAAKQKPLVQNGFVHVKTTEPGLPWEIRADRMNVASWRGV